MKETEHPSEEFMLAAIEEAKRAAKAGNYALGSVVVLNGKLVSIAQTTLHKTPDPSAHAEMNAIRKAAKKMNSRYLEGSWLYTTQEPCPMCASAAVWAKMAGIVYGASKEDAAEVYKKQKESKFTWRKINISADYVAERGEPKLKVFGKVLRDECLKLYELNK